MVWREEAEMTYFKVGIN